MILDSYSVNNVATAIGTMVGFDADKLVKRYKCLVLTDTLASRLFPRRHRPGCHRFLGRGDRRP